MEAKMGCVTGENGAIASMTPVDTFKEIDR